MGNEPTSRSTRRQFLTGRSAAEALADLGRAVPQVPATETAHPTAAYLLEVGRRAMACQFDVYLNAKQDGQDTEQAVAALDLIDQLEAQLSVYRDDSELSQINRLAAQRAIRVEPRLFFLLQRALQLHEETEGAFDITSGPLIREWGFLRRQGRFPNQQQIQHALERVGSQWLQLDASRRTIQFKRPGVEINLGAIGKGYALDRAAALLTNAGIDDFLIHGGHSSILAHGSRADGRGQEGWTVGVRHPLRPERRLAELILRDRALGTSGSGTQHFIHQGRRYGHIIDPRSGWPVEEVWSTSVLAPDGATADALATAFSVLGPEKTEAYCAAHPEIGVLMTCRGPQASSVQLQVINLAPQDWRQLTD